MSLQESSTKHSSHMVRLMLALIAMIFLTVAAAQAATYTVTNTNNSGAGSLRQALINANATAGFDTIAFNIPGAGIHTITPTSALPLVSGITSLDATTQPGYSGTPVIELAGNLAGGVGFQVTGGGSAIKGFIINRFDYGIVLQGGSLNQITGNYLGTNALGTTALGNAAGIFITGSSNNTIGGNTDATRNVISGNAILGILIQANSSGNMIRGNRIGTNAAGTAALANEGDGIAIGTDCNSNVIGGTTVAERNLISGNAGSGIIVSLSQGNTILGNYIGTNAAGTVAVPNQRNGVYIASASNNTIGGTIAGARNVISGNLQDGIFISDEGHPANANTVTGNYIGTNAAGLLGVGNGFNGIEIDESNNNTIGGAALGAGNVISGNGFAGIFIRNNSSGNQVKGNIIGAASTVNIRVPNTSAGIRFEANASNNRIGGTGVFDGNKIYYNLDSGIQVRSNCFNNEILGNSIYLNEGMGIDLYGDGPTANDANDADSGPNNLQNFPVLSSVTIGGGNTTFTGTLNSKPNASYRVEFFTHFACDSARGQGYLMVGTIPSLITNGSGNANFSVTIPTVNTSVGEFITALATDSAGNTSEFSPCTLVTSPSSGTFSFSSATYNQGEGNPTATITVQRTVGSVGTVSVNYATSDGTQAKAPADYTATSGTLVFVNGETSKTFDVPLANDALDEDDETINLTLSSPGGGASLGAPSTAVLTIADNDAPPSISISDVSVAEGNAGTSQATFTVTLSAPSGRLVSVLFNTANGTATAGTDYEADDGGPDFVAGETSKTITILIKGDTDLEADETFFVNLNNPLAATIADGQGQATIINDDAAAPTPNTVQFSQTGYTAAEGDHFKVITVTRSGETTAPATVDYATADLSAQQRTDYTLLLGTLSFAPGESSKQLTLLLSEDSLLEGDETFTLSLSNPVGVSLGAESVAQVTITDNDSNPNAPNAIDGVPDFVRQQYHDFLNREPDPVGFQGWQETLNNCAPGNPACDRIEVSSAFYRSQEFHDRGYFTYRFYSAALGRVPHYEEFMRDLQKVSGFLSEPEKEAAKVRYIEEFMARSEFQQRYDSLVDAGAYVDALLATAGVTLAQRDQLVAGLQSHTLTRGQALRQIVESMEVDQKFFDESFVIMQYFGYLRRDADILYLEWIQTLKQTHDYRIMVNGFMNSPEYRQRFGQ